MFPAMGIGDLNSKKASLEYYWAQDMLRQLLRQVHSLQSDRLIHMQLSCTHGWPVVFETSLFWTHPK